MTTNDINGGAGAPGPSEPPSGSPSEPPSAARRPGRPLYRSRDDRVLGGVAAGLGYWLDIDPVIIRVLFAVLTVFGGVGVLLYGIGYLFIPEAGSPGSLAEGWLAGRRVQRPPALTLAALAVGAIIVLAVVSRDADAIAVLLAVAVVAALAARSRASAAYPPPGAVPPGAAALAPTVPAGTTAPSAAEAPATSPATASWAGAEPPPGSGRGSRWTRRRSTSRLVLGAAAVAAGLALLLDRTGAMHLTLTQVLAIPLAVLGAALALGSLIGRSWIAIVVGLGLTLATLTSVALGGHFSRAQQVTWTPASGDPRSSYHLGSGRARLDLTSAGQLAGRRLSADVGAGRLEVVVPTGTPVRIDADAGVGSLHLLGTRTGGVGLHRTVTDGAFSTADGLELDLHVGVGQVEVTHD
ncbi:MAG: PspC domain-containing protein [Frankiaceae bacterium]